jgi:hypothetical protein
MSRPSPRRCGTISPEANLHQQPLITHARQIAPVNADIGEVLGTNFSSFLSQGYSPLPQGRLGTTGESNALRAVALSLSYSVRRFPDRCQWRIGNKRNSLIFALEQR